MITLCDKCDNVVDKKANPRYWACIKHIRLLDGFVSSTARVTNPYLFCRDVNGGACPLFEDIKYEANICTEKR